MKCLCTLILMSNLIYASTAFAEKWGEGNAIMKAYLFRVN